MACYKVDGKDFKNVQGIIYISHIVLLYDFESTSRMDYFYGAFFVLLSILEMNGLFNFPQRTAH